MVARAPFRLPETQNDFTGKALIKFDLKAAVSGISLNFTGGEITEFQINSKKVEKPNYTKFYLPFQNSMLVAGTNEVRVKLKHRYSTDGNGLYRFQDPEDERVYVYSKFEPYFANLVFPLLQ